jgi:hypothetical protein
MPHDDVDDVARAVYESIIWGCGLTLIDTASHRENRAG